MRQHWSYVSFYTNLVQRNVAPESQQCSYISFHANLVQKEHHSVGTSLLALSTKTSTPKSQQWSYISFCTNLVQKEYNFHASAMELCLFLYQISTKKSLQNVCHGVTISFCTNLVQKKCHSRSRVSNGFMTLRNNPSICITIQHQQNAS